MAISKHQFVDPLGSYNKGLQFKHESEIRPLDIALAQQNIDNAGQQFKVNQQTFDQRTKDNQFTNQQNDRTKMTQEQEEAFGRVHKAAQQVSVLPNDMKADFFKQNIAEIEARRGDSTQSRQMLSLIEQGRFEDVNRITQGVLKQGIDRGLSTSQINNVSAEYKGFESLIENFSPEDKSRAQRIKAGLSPREVGSATQTIANLGTTATIADVESAISGAKETGKLTAQWKLKSEVESAIAMAVGNAKIQVDKMGENRSNSRTLGIYNTAMSNLEVALGNTYTGKVAGLSPAFTTNQQIADGAGAMLLPLMKDVFRGAGEGTFTEGDQKILTALIPTRSDTPEAIVSKVGMIDTMIKAKLAIEDVGNVDDKPFDENDRAELEALRVELGIGSEQ